MEHVICGTTRAFREQVIHVLHIIRPRWNIQHTPDLMGLTAQGGKVWFECTIGSAAGETRSVEQDAARQLDKLNNFLFNF